MFICEEDFLVNLVSLTSKNARKRFRNEIFNEWNWRCAYCDEELTEMTATVDHIVPKYKGGQSISTNLCCCCGTCNHLKGSKLLKDWYTINYPFYCEERLGKIKSWMSQNIDSIQFFEVVKPSSSPF